VVVDDWQATQAADRVWSRGVELTWQYASVTLESTLAEHSAFWKNVWGILDIEIEGDPDVLQGLRFSCFQTYQTYHGKNADLNALCKGLTGEVYFGWVFWDSEIYSHRLMMFIDLPAAKNLLLYRHHLLPQALERAKQLDCEGARFPFASITGTEDRDTWQHVDLEIHADMAVAYAIWHYNKICNDKEFLYHEGIEMLLQICRFLAGAGGWIPLHGEIGFYGVMGPDEFHMMMVQLRNIVYLRVSKPNNGRPALEEFKKAGRRWCQFWKQKCSRQIPCSVFLSFAWEQVPATWRNRR
jgi:maltose phosphorylase